MNNSRMQSKNKVRNKVSLPKCNPVIDEMFPEGTGSYMDIDMVRKIYNIKIKNYNQYCKSCK